MSARGKLRGHEIIFNGNQWVYTDTGESTASTWKSRPCGHCNKFPTKEGHDPCLGTLPNVMNACCGHGDKIDAYVQFEDKSVLNKDRAIKYFKNNAPL